MAVQALSWTMKTQKRTRHLRTLMEHIFKGAELDNTQIVLRTGWEARE